MSKKKTNVPIKDLVINQGDDFSFQIRLKDSENQPLNIEGYEYTLKVRENAESDTVVATATCTVLEPQNGLVDIHFPNAETSQIDTTGLTYQDLGTFYYDIVQTNTEGRKERILQGQLLVSPGISYH